MDQGGGGSAVEELINMSDNMEGNDVKIYRHDDDLHNDGKKILYVVNFTSNWIEAANASLQKNIEDKRLMFPMAIAKDANEEAQDCIYEINELKKELTSIEVSITSTGRRHFDLKPIIGGAEDVVRHKDRYSSLLVGNYVSKVCQEEEIDPNEDAKKAHRAFLGDWLDNL
jgi:hypothetical protein